MNKHVLVVGVHAGAHAKLKALGHRLTLLSPLLKLKDLEDLTVYDRAIGLDADAENNEWVQHAVELDRRHPVDVVASFNELQDEYAAAIGEALGLPFHEPEVVVNVRYKHKMRQALNAAGVDPTVGRLVENRLDLEDFASRYGYPIVLKPADGRGSAGVSLITRAEDIPAAVEWSEEGADFPNGVPERSVLYAEQFLNGEEFSVEAMSEGGEHHVICITKKYKSSLHFVEIGHCLPAVVDASLNMSIHQLVGRTLTALGIEFGPSHTEVIVTESGPRVVETHTRLAGDNIPDLIRVLTGVDLLDYWVEQVGGEGRLESLPELVAAEQFAAIWYTTPQTTGRVESVDGEDQARAVPGVVDVKIYRGPGAMVGGLHDTFSRPACAIATGRSPEEALEAARQACRHLRFAVSPAEDRGA